MRCSGMLTINWCARSAQPASSRTPAIPASHADAKPPRPPTAWGQPDERGG